MPKSPGDDQLIPVKPPLQRATSPSICLACGRERQDKRLPDSLIGQTMAMDMTTKPRVDGAGSAGEERYLRHPQLANKQLEFPYSNRARPRQANNRLELAYSNRARPRQADNRLEFAYSNRARPRQANNRLELAYSNRARPQQADNRLELAYSNANEGTARIIQFIRSEWRRAVNQRTES
jgi:hypothetical protein